VFLRTAPAAFGVLCRLGGEATCQYAKTAYRAVRQLLGRFAGQAAPRRIALVCWIWMVRGEGNGTTEGEVCGVRLVRVCGGRAGDGVLMEPSSVMKCIRAGGRRCTCDVRSWKRRRETGVRMALENAWLCGDIPYNFAVQVMRDLKTTPPHGRG
jgi:hypothetical protein